MKIGDVEILDQNQLIEKVEDFLKNKKFTDLLPKNIEIYEKRDHLQPVIVIDIRDGKIDFLWRSNNIKTLFNEFFLSLASIGKIQLTLEDILKDDIEQKLSFDQITEFLGRNWNFFHRFTKTNDGKFIVNFNSIKFFVSVEIWMDKFCSESYYKTIKNCIDFYLEDFGADWKNQIIDFYKKIKNIKPSKKNSPKINKKD